MKRIFFFWLEKLQITRAERKSVSLLLLLLMLLVVLNGIIQPETPFQDDYYQALEQEFHKRTAQLKQKEHHLLRHYGITTADTLPTDSLSPEVPSAVININEASAAQLERLPGIGATYAQRIIKYRRQHGGFTTKVQLLQIEGIGSTRLAKLKPLITLGAGSVADSLQSQRVLPIKTSTKEIQQTAAYVINVNTADAATLERLPGIGPTYARRIIAYRQENGVFTSKKQLLQIKGIGKKRLAKLKPFIKLTAKKEHQK